MIDITIDGKGYQLQEGENLFEAFKLELGDHHNLPGFCHHPLFESSQKCLLCTVRDEKTGELVKACEIKVNQGDSFLLDDEKVKEATEELKNIYFKGHIFHCTSCENQNQCNFFENFGDGYPRLEKNQSSNEIKESRVSRLNHHLTLDLKECLHCSLCSDFEKAVTANPTLKLEEDGLHVAGSLDHNMGINLIDLCPTGCFKDDRVSRLKSVIIEDDFCRGCDRLCRIDLHLGLTASGKKPVRSSSPKSMSHWICDEANEVFKHPQQITLNSILKKEGGKWALGDAQEDLLDCGDTNDSWHLFLPENLPDEMWQAVLHLLQMTPKSLKAQVSFIDWPSRSKESGLLRRPRNFKQSQRQEVEALCEVIPLFSQDLDSQRKAIVVAPEYIKSNDLWAKLVGSLIGYRSITYVGPYVDHGLYECADLLIPVPQYHTMSWSGLNYLEEKLSIKRSPPKISLLKETLQ